MILLNLSAPLDNFPNSEVVPAIATDFIEGHEDVVVGISREHSAGRLSDYSGPFLTDVLLNIKVRKIGVSVLPPLALSESERIVDVINTRWIA